jgi:hypothetical protein
VLLKFLVSTLLLKQGPRRKTLSDVLEQFNLTRTIIQKCGSWRIKGHKNFIKVNVSFLGLFAKTKLLWEAEGHKP